MDRHRAHTAIVAAILALFSSSLSFAAAPASVEVTGDFKVNGAGSGVVFPDNTKQTSAAVNYVRTVLVNPVVGGTIQDNGTALRTALDSIADASATKRYLIKIEPGTFDVGSTGISMKEYVDMEGSGQHVTIITGTPSNIGYPQGCTLSGASNAELRFLTVKNTATLSGGYAAAICNTSSSPSLTHVTAICSGGTAVCFGIVNSASSSILTNVHADASEGTGTNVAIASFSSPSSPSSGPTLVNVKATANTTPCNYAYGVYNRNGGSQALVVMSSVSAEASGGAQYAAGVYNNNVSAVMKDVTAVGTSSPKAFGVMSGGYTVVDAGTGSPCTSCIVRIHNSILRGSLGALGEWDTNWGLVTKIANSQLNAAISVATPARITCAGVFDESYVFWPSTCPP